MSGFLAPLAEQMEDEEQRRRLRLVGWIERQIGIDLVEKDRDHLGTLRGRRLQCRLRQAFSVG